MLNPELVDDDHAEVQRKLLLRWQGDGDLEALDLLLKSEVQVIKKMVTRRAPSLLGTMGATDIAHEAVLGLLRVKSAPEFPTPQALRAYLWMTAWRLLLARMEKKDRKPLSLDLSRSEDIGEILEATSGLGAAVASERSVAVDLAMNLLNSEDRELLRLVYFDDHDIAAAGAKLGIKRETANMRLVRARRRLAGHLASWSEHLGA